MGSSRLPWDARLLAERLRRGGSRRTRRPATSPGGSAAAAAQCPANGAGGVHDLPAHHRQHRLDGRDPPLGHGEIVLGQHGEVGQLARLQRAPLRPPRSRTTPAAWVYSRRARSRSEPVRLRVERQAAHGPPRDQPVQADPRVVARHPRGVRPGRRPGCPSPASSGDRRRPLGRLRPVAVDEVLALVRHPVLDGDAAAQRLDPLEVPVGHRLGVVEEPVQAVERHVAVDRLEDVEEPADRLVVGGVQAERPSVLGQQPHDGGQVPFQRRRQVGPGLEEVLEVGRREGEHLAGPVHPVERRRPSPGLVIPTQRRKSSSSPLGLLREQVVGDADASSRPGDAGPR